MERFVRHTSPSHTKDIQPELCSLKSESFYLNQELKKRGITNTEVADPPLNCEIAYRTLLTSDGVEFLSELCQEFDKEVTQMLQAREQRKLELKQSSHLPDFDPKTANIRESNWTVSPVPRRLQCRHVDLGDVSPSNRAHFVAALKSAAQGIQTDFDDGHCPTWANQLQGLYNVYRAVHNTIPGVPNIEDAPVLMLRPRAWNMVEHNLIVNGQEVLGPLFDFGLLMFHNARILLEKECGPYFYLSKLEGSKEAAVWDAIFSWTEKKLKLPHGCVKACVLIENVLASFEMHEILYALRDHSLGLNCGIWDYSASFINKFGHRRDFLLPDRNKYVSMDRHFLKSYMDLVVQTCHQRGCHATGGMAALLLPKTSSENYEKYQMIQNKVLRAKQTEIEAGVDGFMVYDIRLVVPSQQMWKRLTSSDNQFSKSRSEVKVTNKDLLLMPSGGVTETGLKHNIAVGILFIEAWLRGVGHYYYKGAVEDSATAEISRSQIWQWIRFQAILEDNGKQITMAMVKNLIRETTQEMFWSSENSHFVTEKDRQRLLTAAQMFQEIVSKLDFPEFITTYFNLDHTFLKSQASFSFVSMSALESHL
ncbi:malate synthase-like [Saccostrea echinata]|uniref:malate synthase-like n=1 Tax=Saccostrea echinata TaxID=191078 RepID=UPI002A7FCA1D|nr:malate synthase-like [Saccostrea echinata]